MKKIVFILLALLVVACSPYQKATNTHKKLTDREILNVSTIFVDASREKILGNTAKAKKLYEIILDKDPLHDASLYEMALLLAKENNIEEAIAKIDFAIKINTDNKWYKIAKASILQKGGRYEDAAKEYRKLISKYKFEEDFYLSEAECYASAKQNNKAIAVYEELEKHIGYSEELGVKKWYALASVGNEELAMKEMERLAKTFPENPQYTLTLISYYAQKGNLVLANQYADKLLEQDPNNSQGHAFKYKYLKYIGKNESAEKELINFAGNEIVNIDEKVDLFLSIVENQSDSTTIYKALDTLVKVNSNDAKSWSLYADYLYANRATNKAIDMWKKVIELDSSKYLVWEPLMLALYSEKRHDELEKYSSRAVILFPEQFTAWYFNGLAFFDKKKYEEAIISLNMTLDLIYENKEIKIQAMSLLAECYNYTKKYNESDKLFEKVLLINPDNFYVLNNYAYYLALRNENLDKAEQNILRALGLQPKNAMYLDTYAYILFRKGNYIEAEKYLLKSFSFGGDKDGNVIEHYGDVLFFLNRTNEAVEQWEKAKKIGDCSEYIDKKIDDKKYYE